jgi:alpha-tubulin suppressor-like RCC1 family protein
MSATPLTVYAAGDNSLGQLWNSKFKLSPQFIASDSFPCSADDVLQISAWCDSIAINVKGTTVLFKHGSDPLRTFSVPQTKSIACLPTTVLCHLTDGGLFDAVNGPLAGSHYQSFAASSSIVAAIDSRGRAVVLSGDKPETVAKDAIAVGCTDAELFVSTKTSLIRIEGDDRTEIPSAERVISIACSDTESLFLDATGGLFRCELGALIQIFGIPQIAAVAVGPQHYAAVACDGKLFTWGFNPSGQLGIGNDRATIHPACVLDNVSMCACGTHCTVAVRGGQGRPGLPKGFDRGTLGKTAPAGRAEEVCRVTRAELLF